MVGEYRPAIIVNGRAWYSLGAARAELTALVNAAHLQGTVSVIHSKGRKAAIVPLSFIDEFNALRNAVNSHADTKGADVPQSKFDVAHSPREVLRSGFGPLAPIPSEVTDDDDLALTDEEAIEMGLLHPDED